MGLTTWQDGASESRYEDGQILEVVRGPFMGRQVRVDGHSSFWTRETYLMGDPANGIVSPEGWQIVLDIQNDEGEWVYLTRESEFAVSMLTQEVA